MVAPLHPGRGRGGVQVPPTFLYVLAVVALRVGQPKGPFFHNGVAAVPQGESEADQLAVVADTGHAVLVPAISARNRLPPRKVVPRIAVGRVVLAHGAPCSFGQVGTPFSPRHLVNIGFSEPSPFRDFPAGTAIAGACCKSAHWRLSWQICTSSKCK